MKNVVKIPGLLFISILYCYSICITYNNSISSIAFGNEITRESKNFYFSIASNNILYHTSQSESWSNSYNNYTSAISKNPFNWFFTNKNETEHLLFTIISQFYHHSRNILIRCRNTNIIFPFQYFW